MKDFVRFVGTIFAVLLIIGMFLLSGCASKTPTETIVDGHIEHVNQTLDYAYNNIDQTKDVVFLENELKACQLGLIDTKQSYYAEIATCKAKTDYWRLAAAGLLVALVGAVFAIIKRWFI